MSYSSTDESPTKFIATGSFFVSKDLTPVELADGSYLCYKKLDGTEVRIVICLEVETPDGKVSYYPAEKDMAEHGLEGLDYDELKFTRD